MSNLRQAHKTDPSLRHVQNKKTPNVWALHKVQQNQDRARLLQALSLSPEDLEKTNWITKAHMDPGDGSGYSPTELWAAHCLATSPRPC